MSISMLTATKIATIGRRLYARGLIAGGDGNVSARIDAGHIIITPSGRSKGILHPDDMVITDMDGCPQDNYARPSSEIDMHLAVYRFRPDAAACVHAHPPYATAFAVAGQALTEQILPEVVLLVGEIPLTAFASPGTEQVAQSLEPFIADHDAFLLKNHGVVTVGETLEQAYNRMETVEHYARILFLSKQLGHTDRLDEKEIARLETLRHAPEDG